MKKIKFNKLLGKDECLEMYKRSPKAYDYKRRSGRTTALAFKLISEAMSNPNVRVDIYGSALYGMIREIIKDLSLECFHTHNGGDDGCTLTYEPFGDMEVPEEKTYKLSVIDSDTGDELCSTTIDDRIQRANIRIEKL